MASAVETEPWTWGCGGVCNATKQGSHVLCVFCRRKFHLACLPRMCPASELPELSALCVCHAGCLSAYRAGADKRVYCRVEGCPHTKGFAHPNASRVHAKNAHEGFRHACAACGRGFTSKLNCDAHRLECAAKVTGALRNQRELVVAELQDTYLA